MARHAARGLAIYDVLRSLCGADREASMGTPRKIRRTALAKKSSVSKRTGATSRERMQDRALRRNYSLREAKQKLASLVVLANRISVEITIGKGKIPYLLLL